MKLKKIRIKELFEFKGLGKNPLNIINSGDICAIVGIDEFEIGDKFQIQKTQNLYLE